MPLTAKELRKLLENKPDEAIIYVQSDHGQLPEQASAIAVTKEKNLEYYGEDIDWDIKVRNANVTAILIM